METGRTITGEEKIIKNNDIDGASPLVVTGKTSSIENMLDRSRCALTVCDTCVEANASKTELALQGLNNVMKLVGDDNYYAIRTSHSKVLITGGNNRCSLTGTANKIKVRADYFAAMLRDSSVKLETTEYSNVSAYIPGSLMKTIATRSRICLSNGHMDLYGNNNQIVVKDFGTANINGFGNMIVNTDEGKIGSKTKLSLTRPRDFQPNIIINLHLESSASGSEGDSILLTGLDKKGNKIMKVIKIDGKKYKEDTPYCIKKGKVVKA